jgi:hypothetical protein
MQVRKLKSELIVKIQFVISLIKLDINNDFERKASSLHHKLKELISNHPFPLAAAIIMHLQQKNNVKYFCSRMHPFLW